MSVGDVAKAAGIEWAAMTDKSVSFSFLVTKIRKCDEGVVRRLVECHLNQEYLQWEKRAEEDKKRYEREIAAYKNKQ
ncbi:unnamed protein product [Wuchereria bancrofti]|uniref:HMG box domain-containing protein n=1 Tax=Wuchereria bancrofti TaxID=6293 RepID=A0A3P7F4F4_WUCBA|nr:unnamed protein product [Wuchereria bancrofti]